MSSHSLMNDQQHDEIQAITNADQGREWLGIAEQRQRLSTFITTGTVHSVRDILLITASLFSGKLSGNEGNEGNEMEDLFTDDTQSSGDTVDAALCLRVFGVVHQACLTGNMNDWAATMVREHGLSVIEVAILSVLMARFCGLAPRPLHSISTLQDLLGHTPEQRLAVMEALSTDGPLISTGLLTSDDDLVITNRFISLSPGIQSLLSGEPEERFKKPDSNRRRTRSNAAAPRFPTRDPVVTFDRLVLPDFIRQQLDMAVAQCEHGNRLFQEWGLASVMPYGQGTTLLLSGPSGTGKTACAEAMAQALGRPIMEVNLVQVQSEFVGDCEKAIAEAFAEAQEHNAVLFWDEADGLVLNRATTDTDRPWPITQTTTFLKELERFTGICILATNHHQHMDAAIDRRLSLKIAFQLPDLAQRQALWRTLIPDTVPTADDLERDALAQTPLSGGQIKNVVLNAARLAVVRGPDARLQRSDIEQALVWELAGSRDAPESPSTLPQTNTPVSTARAQAPTDAVVVPSTNVNTKPLDDEALVALDMTGVRAPLRAVQRWSGRRFITRNGSLVQLTSLALPKRIGGFWLLLDVLHGGHQDKRCPGYGVGSTYMVDGDGAVVFDEGSEQDGPDRGIVSGMDVVAEVLDD